MLTYKKFVLRQKAFRLRERKPLIGKKRTHKPKSAISKDRRTG